MNVCYSHSYKTRIASRNVVKTLHTFLLFQCKLRDQKMTGNVFYMLYNVILLLNRMREDRDTESFSVLSWLRLLVFNLFNAKNDDWSL